MPWIRTAPLEQGMQFKLIWQALPSWSYSQKYLQATGFKEEEVKWAKLPFTSFLFELCAFGTLLNISNAEGLVRAKAACGCHMLVYDFRDSGMLFIPGQLSCVFPGAGKGRMFAIGNYINQRLLRPFHEWAMLVLKRIPMDRTFNQRAPLRRLVGATDCYSYDLSTTMDRWPLRIIFRTVIYLFDRSFASAAINNCLANNNFLLAFANNKKRLKVHPGKKFDRYAVLGDDVLIADQHVGPVYKSFIDDIGVKISTLKSIVSNTGCIKFAKRFRWD
ncbi:hypothetical protein M9H77_23568 [Catharanthus roseus]|uniref:Uncharacterized protein n=1 Tax=Catharanthus roseus TaxID=4058 RepID=A0ACC0AV68_CATRO|nr:hypothetical protein M9H77_23568 [Catharanthus roseus]